MVQTKKANNVEGKNSGMTIKNWAIYGLIWAIVSSIRILPLSICFGVGQVLGAIAWVLLLRYRRLATKNMTCALGSQYSDAQIKQLVFQNFITIGANFLSALKIPTLSEKEICACCEVENKEYLISRLQKGHGIVMVISHIGNWELFAQLNFLLPKIPTGLVYQSMRNKGIDNLIKKDRQSRGVIAFDRKKSFVAAVAMLRQGGLVGVLADQHAGDSGLWTPFFRRLASTSPLPALLACKSDAVVVPVAVSTIGFARWKVTVDPALSYEKNNPNQLTADINRILELQILRSPADWFWIHDRWKMPDPRIFLSKEKRGIYLPEKFGQLTPFSILVRSSNWLGDAVLSIPTVQALKRGRVDARISILVHAKLAALWRAVPEVDEVIIISNNLWTTAQKLRSKRFDAAILLPNSLRSALEVLLARIPRRIGYRGHQRSWFLNQIISEPKNNIIPHHSERYAHIATQLGAHPPHFQPLIFSSSSAVRELGLCPGAEYGPAKRWPAHNYREVLEEISQQTKCRWKIFGTAKDSDIAKEIITGLSEDIIVDRTGKTTLAQLMSELASVRLLLTNDTGTMHLAALLGVPVVAIFGSTEPLLTSPFGVGNRILREHVECSPCFLRTCPIDFKCMKAITPRQVKETILKFLN